MNQLLQKDKRYLLAISGGSDSMALLAFCLCAKLSIIVAHVNYHVRQSAERDERIVREYCKKHQLTCEVLSVSSLPHGNFEAWARELRYAFFRKLIEQYQLDGVVVAHQLDDHIETYLLQKNRGSVPLCWGLQSETSLEGMKIYRPLLGYSKLQLQQYCVEHHIPYGEDETNYSQDRARNRIRMEQIAKMSKQDKQTLVEQIAQENNTLKAFYEQVKIAEQRCFAPFVLIYYERYEQAVRIEALRAYLLASNIDSRHYSIAYLQELDQLLLRQSNFIHPLNEQFQLVYAYQQLSIEPLLSVSYCYRLDTITVLETLYFHTSLQGDSLHAVTVTADDFPLRIRNWQKEDTIQLRFGHKRISRWFIDRKIPPSVRQSWPVVVNRHNEVILVPEIGCNIAHFSNNPNLFVLKY